MSSLVRDIPFDGGVAHVEAHANGSEHVLLLAPDGGILGESHCVGPVAGYDAVRSFFTDVRTAILSGGVDRAADRMAFPLRVNGATNRLVASRDQFVSEHRQIITPDVIERVRAADPGQVACGLHGHALGDGVLWAELQRDDRLAVWAINLGPGPRKR